MRSRSPCCLLREHRGDGVTRGLTREGGLREREDMPGLRDDRSQLGVGGEPGASVGLELGGWGTGTPGSPGLALKGIDLKFYVTRLSNT